MDWDSDPELKRIRDEFVASLTERHGKLVAAMKKMPSGAAPPRDVVEELRFVAHKLAGTAESYGFPTLTLISESLDELLTDCMDGGEIGAQVFSNGRMAAHLGYLEEALRASLGGGDPETFSEDRRLAGLRADAESTRAGSTS